MKESSIIVPLYNEEKRASKFLDNLLDFCQKNLKDYEIIFVNDGSTDNTLELVKGLKRGYSNVRIISYKKNKGKGGAVREGVLNAEGDKIIFIDADGSIAPDEMPNMIKRLDDYDVVCGSRVEKESKVKQPFLRKITGIGFNLYVLLLFHTGIRDNLCGFKGFKREIAINLFKNLIDRRWVFDVELFYKIKKKRYRLHMLPIKWVHKKGTKISFLDPIRMIAELIKLRIKLLK